jgi:hypothetical protein
MKAIAIFFHGLFFLNSPENLLENAVNIIRSQMDQLRAPGPLVAASEFHVGLNGGAETLEVARLVFPLRTNVTLHGLACRNELRTILMIEEWVKTHQDWYLLYVHAKGASHPPGAAYELNVAGPWRRAMMQDLVVNWRRCIADLDAGADICCSHWMWGTCGGVNNIPAGNCVWVKASFAATLPSLMLRTQIKKTGLDALESRYEAEVYWGNGKRPVVKEYRAGGGGGVP